MTEPNAAQAAPPPKPTIPWLGNLYGALSFGRAPAPIAPTTNAAPAPAAPIVPPVVTKIQEAATPFAPVTVHVHNGKPKGKPKAKADEAAK